MRYSLKYKAILMIIILALILSAASIIVSNKAVSNIAENNYKTEAGNLADTAAAAIGYAVYDADRDGSPDGTFRQADRAMYLRKQEMKSKGSQG